MSVIYCYGCKRQFENEKSLSLHFQHNQTCKSIHYNLNLHSTSNTLYQIQTRNKTKELNSLIEKKKNELFLICANQTQCIDNSMQQLYAHDNPFHFGCSENILYDSTNDMGSITLDDNNQSNLASTIQTDSNATNYMYFFHNDEWIETNLLQIVKEINAPDFAY